MEHLFHKDKSTLLLTATSSMTHSAKFAYMTPKLQPTDIIDFAKIKDRTLQLILQTQPNTHFGNYTIWNQLIRCDRYKINIS